LGALIVATTGALILFSKVAQANAAVHTTGCD